MYILPHTKLHISIESFRTKESRAADMWHGPHSDLSPPFPPSFDCDLINFLLFKAPSGSDGKESACNAGDLGSIPGSRISPGGGHGTFLAWKILMDRMGHGVAKSRTQLSNFHQQARKTLKTLENDKTKPLIGGPGSIQCYG